MASSCHHQHKMEKEATDLFMGVSLHIRMFLGKLISHHPTIHMGILMFVSQKTKAKTQKDRKSTGLMGERHEFQGGRH